jgi:hypothetical protein
MNIFNLLSNVTVGPLAIGQADTLASPPLSDTYVYIEYSLQIIFTGHWLNHHSVHAFIYIQRHVSATRVHHQLYMMTRVHCYTVVYRMQKKKNILNLICEMFQTVKMM